MTRLLVLILVALDCLAADCDLLIRNAHILAGRGRKMTLLPAHRGLAREGFAAEVVRDNATSLGPSWADR